MQRTEKQGTVGLSVCGMETIDTVSITKERQEYLIAKQMVAHILGIDWKKQGEQEKEIQNAR